MISEKRLGEITAGFKTLPPVLVLGDIGVDRYVQGQVERISPEAPVPVLAVEGYREKLGLAANVVDNLWALGIQATLCGVLGMDKTAVSLRELLGERGLDASGLVEESTRQTTLKERVGTATQQICRIDREDKNPLGEGARTEVLRKILNFRDSHPALIIEDYGKGVVTRALLERVIPEFRERGYPVFVDPARTSPPDYYRGASLLKPNKVEATLMLKHLGYAYGEKSLQETAKILCDKLAVEKIVITLGTEGMFLYDSCDANGVGTIVPTATTEVFDVSGAGDTAMALLAACLSGGATLKEAVLVANCGATAVVGKRGTAVVKLGEVVEVHGRMMEKA